MPLPPPTAFDTAINAEIRRKNRWIDDRFVFRRLDAVADNTSDNSSGYTIVLVDAVFKDPPVTAAPTCGHTGGRTKRGAPCTRKPKAMASRCYLHPWTAVDELRLRPVLDGFDVELVAEGARFVAADDAADAKWVDPGAVWDAHLDRAARLIGVEFAA